MPDERDDEVFPPLAELFSPDGSPADGWRCYASRLADALVARGCLTDADDVWREAFAQVPRHLLVPPGWEHGWSAAYSDALDSLGGWVGGADGDSGVLAWAVHLIADRDREVHRSQSARVLQVGAGHGYLTAVLCQGLGDRHVVATEPDPARARDTAAVLAGLGWYPEILPGRPGRASAEHGPYDGVLLLGARAAAVVAEVFGQLAPGGRMVIGPTRLRHPGGWEVLDRTGDGLIHSRRITGPAPHHPPGSSRPLAAEALTSADLVAVEFLHAHPGVAADIRAEHIADDAGYCRSCWADDHGHRQLAPCPARTLADLAQAGRARDDKP